MTAARNTLYFLKNWMLPISIVVGISSYLIYHNTPSLYPAGPVLHTIVSKSQATLIGILIFLQFLKMPPREMKFHRWHLILLAFQLTMSALFAIPAALFSGTGAGILFECAMICFICPTASAAAVITGRLGGSDAACMTYNVLCNALTTILIPAAITFIHPDSASAFMVTVSAIGARIFPILLLPCFLAWTIMTIAPRLYAILAKYSHWSFYIWGICLVFAMILSTRALILSHLSAPLIASIVLISIAACAIQFTVGQKIGIRFGESERITARQALGQKNTGFLIWIGYTFMTPVTSVAGGLYAIWQNLFNSWELRRSRKTTSS